MRGNKNFSWGGGFELLVEIIDSYSYISYDLFIKG